MRDRRALRLLVAAVVSVLLHASIVVGWWVLGRARLQGPRARPLEITIVAPRVPAAKEEQGKDEPARSVAAVTPRREVPPSAKVKPVQVPAAVASVPPLPVAPAKEGKSENDSSLDEAGPRRAPPVDLFAADAIGHAAQGVGVAPASGDGGKAPLSGGALAKARIDGWVREFKAGQRVVADATPPPVRELGQRLNEGFIPAASSLEKASRFGLGALSSVSSFIDNYLGQLEDMRGHSIGGSTEPLVKGAGDVDPKLLRSRRDRSPATGICFGSCSGGSHQVAALAVTVDIDHDELGVPAHWRVRVSSGDDAFDKEALSAIRYGLDFGDTHVLLGPPTPRWSRWVFSAHALRYARSDLLLDPGFVQPGKELEEHSGILGKTTLVRAVRLVAIEYRHARKE